MTLELELDCNTEVWDTCEWFPTFVEDRSSCPMDRRGDCLPAWCCWMRLWCWISGLARWLLVLLVKCWYKLVGWAGGMEVWWADTIVVLLLFVVVGKFMPGTVAESGTDTTRLSGCCSLTAPADNFVLTFCVITCCLLMEMLDVGIVTIGALTTGLLLLIDALVDFITLGLTFWMFGSAGVVVVTVLVDALVTATSARGSVLA